jgi:Rnl2 family RNA ligase
MRHRSYPRIGGPTQPMGGTWVATEKLHGANFVVGIAGEVVVFGKRKAWLAPDDPFFGWQLIAPDLAAAVRELARRIGAAQVVAYGELFGGGYPHPAVAAVPGLAPVQTGVWYAPDLRWAMFDVLVATGDDDDGELLAHAEVEQLAAAAAIATPPVLGRGRRDELERMAVDAPTAVPAQLGWPELAGNRREGYVLKPDRRAPPATRPAIKHKLPDFDDARFDEARPWEPGWLGADELTAWARRLVNPARVASARSKVGADRRAIVDEIVLDVMIDLATVFTAAWRHVDREREAALQGAIRDAALEVT